MKKKIFLFATLTVILVSIALSVTRYIDSLKRIFTAIIDLFTSILYYFVKLPCRLSLKHKIIVYKSAHRFTSFLGVFIIIIIAFGFPRP